MEMSGSQFIIFCILSFTLLVHVSQAQDSPRDYLNAHNAARRLVSVGPMRWNAQVAAYAQDHANRMARTCRLVRSGGTYGENLAGSIRNMSGAAAVNLWVGEGQYYNYRTNTCNRGRVCSRYTQVVWRNSVWLGCAKARCVNGGTVIICCYSPRGNLGGRPY